MLSDFLFAFNAVLPIFVVALTGYLLKNKGFLTDNFISVADKLVFNVLLPCMLFTKVAFIDSRTVTGQDFKLLVFCVSMAVLLCVVLCFTVPFIIKDKAKTGAFIQGVFRSNVAFLGVPFSISLFDDEGGTLAAIVLAAVVPVYNVMAVAVLCIFNPDQSSNRIPLFKRIVKILKGVVTNPLIIAIVIALPFGFMGLCEYIPSAVSKTLYYFADASTPLALILVGASFSFAAFRERAGVAISAAVLKTVVSPAVFMFLAFSCFGFTGVHLGIVLIVFGTPTAISSYIMAKNMNSDGPLANQIVLLTTLFSMFTIFLYSFVMRVLGMF